MKTILIVDFSTISHSTFHVSLKDHNNYTEEDVLAFWRHTIISSIISRKQKIKPDEIVLCLDNGSWRNKYFPYYKARRKLKKAQSDIDYQFFYDASDILIQEIRDNFPWKIVSVKDCEGDDSIAILATELSKENRVVVLSSDKDLLQLTSLNNIEYYSYRENKFKNIENPKEHLLRLVLGGDPEDDIPNCHSQDNCFVIGQRQKPCGPKKIDSILETGIDEYFEQNPEYKDYYKRNKKLIVLSEETIPKYLWKNVLDEYNKCEPVKPDFVKIAQFLHRNKLNKLKDKIQHFF